MKCLGYVFAFRELPFIKAVVEAKAGYFAVGGVALEDHVVQIELTDFIEQIRFFLLSEEAILVGKALRKLRLDGE